MNKLTSVSPGPPAVTQSDPGSTLDHFRQPDVRVNSHEWGEITAVTKTLVPRFVPRQDLVTVEHEARSAIVEVIFSVLAMCRFLYTAPCPSVPREKYLYSFVFWGTDIIITVTREFSTVNTLPGGVNTPNFRTTPLVSSLDNPHPVAHRVCWMLLCFYSAFVKY